MNNNFQINRFGKLLRKELQERMPFILKVSLILSMIMVGFWLTKLIFSQGTAMYYTTRVAYLQTATYISAMLAPFLLYKGFNHPKKGVDYISLPASIKEKYISMIIISLIVMPAATFIAIVATDTIITLINPSVMNLFLFDSTMLSDLRFTSFANALILPSFCILGNLLFKSNKMIKTALGTGVVYIIFVSLFAYLFLHVYQEQSELIKEMDIRINSSNFISLFKSEIFEGYPGIRITAILLALTQSVVFPVGALSGAYYRMKTLQY